MNKLLPTLVVAAVLTLACAPVALAAPDPIEEAYQTYESMMAAKNAHATALDAYDEGDYHDMEAAYDELVGLTSDFTEEQSAAFMDKLAEGVGLDTYLADCIDVAAMIQAKLDWDAFEGCPSMSTAYALFSSFNAVDQQGNPKDYDILQCMLPGIAAGYTTALSEYCDPNMAAIALYEVTTPLVEAVEFGDIEGLKVALEDFEPYAEQIGTDSTLTSEEQAAYADLLSTYMSDMGSPIENSPIAAAETAFSYYFDANVVLTVCEFYDAFILDPTVDTAQAFVDMIDGFDEIYGGDRSLLERFFYDVNEVYAEAFAMLPQDSDGEGSGATDGSGSESAGGNGSAADGTNSAASLAATGDSPVAVIATAIAIAALIVAVFARKRQLQ